MSLGNVNPLNTSTFTLTGGLTPTANALRPNGPSISRNASYEDESTVAIWSRLEDLRRQRAEAETDIQQVPRDIDGLRSLIAVLARNTGGTVGAAAEQALRQAGLGSTLDRLKQGALGLALPLADDDDLQTVLFRLQGALDRLQLRLRQAPTRIAEAGREMARLQSRLQQFDIAYDGDTGALTYTHTGQSVDPIDLLTRLWDRMKESRKLGEPAKDKVDDEEGTDTLSGLMELLASLYSDGKLPELRRDGRGPQPLDPPERQVRAYVMTQMVVSGGTGANQGARVYQAKRPVMCDADEVQAGGMASFVADTLVIGSRGLKEIEDRSRERPESGPAAFAALVA